jgi:predicted metal-dependent hydrolase
MIQLSLDFLGRQMERLRSRPEPRVRSRREDHELEWKSDIRVRVVFRARARRYLLSVADDGVARLVIPRRGTEAEGLLKRLAKWRVRAASREPWRAGTRFLFRGEEVELRVETTAHGVRLDFAEQVVLTPRALEDYREVVLRHLRRIAERELPVRTRDLAARHGIEIARVSVRAQRSRWGSWSII